MHEGGQLFNTGPVADSAAGAAGVAHSRPTARGSPSHIEIFGAASRRFRTGSRTRESHGSGVLRPRRRGARRLARATLIVWRGRDFVKDEGDPNYLSLRRDGQRYGGIRDYAEAGLARRFTLAPGAVLEVSGRLHRTERYYEYSYRVLSIAALGWKLR